MKRQRGGIEMYIIGALAIAGLTALAWAAWASFTDGYREEGRAEVREKYSVIAECDKRKIAPAACLDHWLAAMRDQKTAQDNFDGCQSAAAVQSSAVDAAKDAEKAAKDATAKILNELNKQSAARRADTDRLIQLAAIPAANEKEACDEAKRILADLRGQRLRYFSGSAPDSGGANRDPAGAGRDALLVR